MRGEGVEGGVEWTWIYGRHVRGGTRSGSIQRSKGMWFRRHDGDPVTVVIFREQEPVTM